jgi:hypothetical protein
MKKVFLFVLFFSFLTTFSQPYCVNYSYGPLGSTTNLYLYTASTPHPINAGCYGEADFDHIINFTPSTPGYYEVFVFNNYQLVNCWYCTPNISFAFRQSNGLCNYNSFTCLIPDSIRYPSLSYPGIFMMYTIYTPLIDSTYDLLLVPQEPGTIGSTDIIIRCGGPKNINITPNTTDAIINFNCNCPNSTFLEYGPKGFIP